jgi:hypothetical protein
MTKPSEPQLIPLDEEELRQTVEQMMRDAQGQPCLVELRSRD